jgi:hypothetical protein
VLSASPSYECGCGWTELNDTAECPGDGRFYCRECRWRSDAHLVLVLFVVLFLCSATDYMNYMNRELAICQLPGGIGPTLLVNVGEESTIGFAPL